MEAEDVSVAPLTHSSSSVGHPVRPSCTTSSSGRESQKSGRTGIMRAVTGHRWRPEADVSEAKESVLSPENQPRTAFAGAAQ